MTTPQNMPNTYEFYYKLCVELSKLTNQRHFDPTDIVEVTVDGIPYSVGPFEQAGPTDDPENQLYEKHWMFNFPNSEYAIGMSDDNWSSWGHMYADEGNNFEIFKKFSPKVVYSYDGTYDEYNSLPEDVKMKFSFPNRNRW